MPGARSGIFVIAPITGAVGDRIAELQRRYDPRLPRLGPPHVTLAGSSGMGPIRTGTTPTALEAALAPIAATTAPLTLRFGAPTRFMQTDIVVLPLDPHGALRTLHERIKTSGLPAAAPRFYFTPHVTLSLYRELPRADLAALLAERVDEPARVDEIQCHLTRDTGESTLLLTLPLGGAPSGG